MNSKDEKIRRQIMSFVSGYLEKHGYQAQQWDLEPIPTDGSTRLFWRVKGPTLEASFVAMVNPPTEDFLREENQAYLFIGRHLHQRGVPVPQIFAHKLLRGFFLMADLGTTSLQAAIKNNTNPLPYYERVLDILVRLHTKGPKGFDTQWCCQTCKYDRYVMRSLESDYFKKAFLIGYLGLDRDLKPLDKDFDHLADMASLCNADSVIHRDFQSRNIMIQDDGVGILDWQGARLGPPAYDLASLVVDPYVDLDWSTRDAIYERYIKALAPSNLRWARDLERYFWYVAIQRNLQILGAFGFLTKQRQKQNFEEYIPRAVGILNKLLDRVQDNSLENLRALAHELVTIVKQS